MSGSRKSLRGSTVGIKRVPASVQLLENRLQSFDEEIREQAYRGIFKLGAPPDPLVEKCEEQVHHQNWYVREAGVNALAHCLHAGCGMLAAETIPPLLEHEDPHIRRCAAETLVEIERQHREFKKDLLQKGKKADDEAILKATAVVEYAVQMLVTVLENPDPKIRLNSIKALGRMGDWVVPHAKALCEHVIDECLQVRNEFMKILSQLNVHLLEGLPIIAAALGHDELRFRLSSERSLLDLATHCGPEVAQAVCGQLKSENKVTRITAMDCLAKLGHLAGHHGTELAEHLEEHDPEVRVSAVHTMICAGRAMQSHLSDIKNRLHHRNADISRAAVQTLRGLASMCPKIARSAFKDLEEEPDLKTRMMAVEILGGAGHNAHPYLEEVVKCLEDKDWSLRRNAIEALCDLGEHAEPAASEVARRLLHHEPDVRRAAAEALGRMGLHSGEFGHRVEGLLDTEEDLDVKRTVAAACELLYAAGMERGH